MLKKIKIITLIFIASFSLYAQEGVGINITGNDPDQSAMLDVVSTNKGMLIPRVALTATNVTAPITAPTTSLLVYNTATVGSGTTAVVEGYYYWNGTEWIPFVVGNLVGTDDQLIDSLTLNGLTLSAYLEDGGFKSVGLKPVSDSAVSFLINNADTLLSNSTFVNNLSDSLLNNNSFVTNLGDSITNNNTFISNLGDSLLSNTSFVTNLGDSLFLSQNFLDSINAAIYNNGDTLLYNSSFVNNLRDSIDTDVDSVKLIGNMLTIYENGNVATVNLSSLTDADSDPSNELQTISLIGSTITLSNSGGSFSINDADNDPTNEIELPTTAITNQILTWNGSAWIAQNAPSGADDWGSQTIVTGVGLSGNGTLGNPLVNTFTEVDGSITNELQTISKTGSTVSLSNGGGNFTDADTQLTEAQVDVFVSNNGYLTSFTEVDGSITNELQTISKTGSTVSLSNGGGSFSVNDGDSNIGNEYNTNMTISGGSLHLTDGGGVLSVSLSSLNDNDWNSNGTGLEAAASNNNVASGNYAIAAGFLDSAIAAYATVGGGKSNSSTSAYATIGGGLSNSSRGNSTTVAGGWSNAAIGFYSAIGGGKANTTTASYTAVGGGWANSVGGFYSVIGGGRSNSTIGSYSVVGGGYFNTAQSYGEWVGGLYATVGIGNSTSYVATDRLFVVGNGTNGSNRSNAFYILKNGNSYTNGSTFVTSDKNVKEKIKPLDGSLSNLLKLNGYTYYWKDNGIRCRDKQIGLLSQEVEVLYPELLMNVEGVKALNYQGLIPVIIEAIKEQQIQILKLKKENASYKIQLEKQQQEIDELKEMMKEVLKTLK